MIFLFRINKERQINPRDDTMKWKLLLSPICTPTLYLLKKKKKKDKTENPIKIKKSNIGQHLVGFKEIWGGSLSLENRNVQVQSIYIIWQWEGNIGDAFGVRERERVKNQKLFLVMHELVDWHSSLKCKQKLWLAYSGISKTTFITMLYCSKSKCDS